MGREAVVLFGSQTGTAEDVAEGLAGGASERGVKVWCVSMDAYDLRSLPRERLAIFVVSTTGEGEVPDAMRPFWTFLLRRDLPAGALGSLRYATFGLGDSGYPKFNYAAKRLHRRLAQLGATPLLPCGLGDDQDNAGLDEALHPWCEALWPQIESVLGRKLRPPPPADAIPAPRYTLTPIVETSQRDDVDFSSVARGAATPCTGPEAGRFAGTGAPAGADQPPSAHNPWSARVLVNIRITREGQPREVRHLEVDLAGFPVAHQPGDALAVLPRNDPEATKALLDALGIVQPHARFRLQPSSPLWRTWRGMENTSAFELFHRVLDVFGVARRPFFERLARFATDPDERERLAEFGSATAWAELEVYALRPRRTMAEVLHDFRSARPPLERYAEIIPPLRHRYFSIASSPLLHPGVAHLTVAVVSYRTIMQAPRKGVCSNYLAKLSPGESVSVWLRRGCLRLPPAPPSTPTTHLNGPLLLVGPGTGIAPLRAIIQHRHAERLRDAGALPIAPGSGCGTSAAVPQAPDPAPTSHCVLYSGCRCRGDDFLYAAEWDEYARQGTLADVHVAFSREGPKKVYVQHRMAESHLKVQLGRLLADARTHIYVCGAANQMPKAVRAALADAAVRQCLVDSTEEAMGMLAKMEMERRLQFETW